MGCQGTACGHRLGNRPVTTDLRQKMMQKTILITETGNLNFQSATSKQPASAQPLNVMQGNILYYIFLIPA